jgi:hypothetical protein
LILLDLGEDMPLHSPDKKKPADEGKEGKDLAGRRRL